MLDKIPTNVLNVIAMTFSIGGMILSTLVNNRQMKEEVASIARKN